MWSVPLYTYLYVSSADRGNTLGWIRVYSSIESADRDGSSSERAESSPRWNLGKYFNPWLSNLCLQPPAHRAGGPDSHFAKHRHWTLKPYNKTCFEAQMFHNYISKFELSELSLKSHLLKLFRQDSPDSQEIPHLEKTLQQVANLGQIF